MIPGSAELSQWKLQVRAPHLLHFGTSPGKKKQQTNQTKNNYEHNPMAY